MWQFHRPALTGFCCITTVMAAFIGAKVPTMENPTPTDVLITDSTGITDISAYQRYEQSREALIAEQQKPDKDFARIDGLINALEALQLEIKREHGLNGNNPNE